MDGIPEARNKAFPSDKAMGIITSNEGEVIKGKDSYNARFEQGEIKISKLKFTGLNRDTLRSTLESMEQLDEDIQQFGGYRLSLQTILREADEFDTKIVEELFSNGDNTKFLFLNMNHKYQKYDVAVCLVKCSAPINSGIMVGFLIKEGLLGKCESGKLYLQI